MTLSVSVCDATGFLDDPRLWDDLLLQSRTDTVFLRSAWLRASWTSTFREKQVFSALVHCGEDLVAGALFVERHRCLEFLGTGSSDYLDIAVDRSLGGQAAAECTAAVVSEALKAAPRARCLLLRNIPVEGGTPEHLASLGRGWWVTPIRTTVAPTMDIAVAPKMLRKKSLRRHENALARQGTLSTVRLTDPGAVLERLPDFFDQHIRRWSGTRTPSLFHDPAQRDLYCRLTENLGACGWLRYTEVRLDGRMIAAHFGMLYGGRFTWYKPTFEPELARFSPGEVLLKRLIEQAVEEGAEEFDFTIGGEAFKKRFATRTRTVADFHVTRDPVQAARIRGWLALKRAVRPLFGAAGLWEPLRRWRARTRRC